MQEARVMGLDVGDVRTGVAMSDPLGMIASPHSVIPVKDIDADCRTVAKLASDNDVTEIVVGLPLNRNGEIGPQAEKVQRFIERLREVVDVPVVTQDERFSSASAERALIEADVRRKQRKQIVDKVAAQQILQVYLDRRANLRKRGS